MERVLGHSPHDPGKVAEEDAERRVRVGELGRGRASRRAYVRGSTPTTCTREPAQLELDGLVPEHRDAVDRGEDVRVDPLRERVAAVREVVVPEHDEARPELARAAARARGAPRRRETRSPVTQTRSGRRSATHATASSAARRPRDGTPRWRSERCAMRSPSSAAGTPASSTSSTRFRSHPASNHPHASAPATSRARSAKPQISTRHRPYAWRQGRAEPTQRLRRRPAWPAGRLAQRTPSRGQREGAGGGTAGSPPVRRRACRSRARPRRRGA